MTLNIIVKDVIERSGRYYLNRIVKEEGRYPPDFKKQYRYPAIKWYYIASVVYVKGNFDIIDVLALDVDALDGLLETERDKVILDLKGLNYKPDYEQLMLFTIALTISNYKRDGGDIIFANLNKKIKSSIWRSYFLKIMEIFDTTEEAIKAFDPNVAQK